MSVPQAALRWYDNTTSFYNIDVSPHQDFSGTLSGGLLSQNLWWNITTTNSGILRSITIWVGPTVSAGTGVQLGTLTVGVAVKAALGVFTTVHQTSMSVVDGTAGPSLLQISMDNTGTYSLRVDAPQTYRISLGYSGTGTVSEMCGDYDPSYNSNAATALAGLPTSVKNPYPACRLQLAADGGWTGYTSIPMPVPPKTQMSDASKTYWGYNNAFPDPDNTISNLDARFCTLPVPSIGANNCDGWVNPIHWAPGTQWNPIDYPNNSAIVTPDTLNNTQIVPGPTRNVYGLPFSQQNQPWGEPYTKYTVMTTCDELTNPTFCDPNSGTYVYNPMVYMDLRRPALDAGWSAWGEWGECQADCGGTGLQYSMRHCDNPGPTLNAKGCQGDYIKSQTCAGEPCLEQVCPVSETVSYNVVNTPHTTVYQSDGTVIGTGAVSTTQNSATIQVAKKTNWTVWLLLLIFIIVVAMSISFTVIDDQPYTIVE